MATLDKKTTRGIFCVIVTAVMLMGVGSLCSCVEATSGDKPRYSKNEDGNTYGSISDSINDNEEPDLIAAIATNGAEGYVYNNDLSSAQDPQVSNPAEAIAYMNEKDSQSAEALKAALNKRIDNSSQITSEEAETLLNMIRAQGNSIDLEAALSQALKSESYAYIGEKISSDTDESLDAGSILMTAYTEARKEVSTAIPVYELDGKTVIGEFFVGSL